jgi:hypothetical protein
MSASQPQMPEHLTSYEAYRDTRPADPEPPKKTALTEEPSTPAAEPPAPGPSDQFPTSQWARGQKPEDRVPLYRVGSGAKAVEQPIDTASWVQFIGAPYGVTRGMYNGWNVEDPPSYIEYQAMIDYPGASSAPQQRGPGINVQQEESRRQSIIADARRGMTPAPAENSRSRANA